MRRLWQILHPGPLKSCSFDGKLFLILLAFLSFVNSVLHDRCVWSSNRQRSLTELWTAMAGRCLRGAQPRVSVLLFTAAQTSNHLTESPNLFACGSGPVSRLNWETFPLVSVLRSLRSPLSMGGELRWQKELPILLPVHYVPFPSHHLHLHLRHCARGPAWVCWRSRVSTEE